MDGKEKFTASAPLNQIPLYVRTGSILPTGPQIQHMAETIGKPITLTVYPDKYAKYTLYLNDGTSYDYEHGDYAEITISYKETDSQLTIIQVKGDYLTKHKQPITFIIKKLDGQPIKLLYTGKPISKMLSE